MADADTAPPPHLALPVVDVVARYPPYQQFCDRRPADCDLSGPGALHHDRQLLAQLLAVTSTVNRQIRFALDRDLYGTEDYWALPAGGYGDCEDLALEKRARLVGAGRSPGALRLAFVFHRRHMTSHAVLTVETTRGTYVLDSDSNAVRHWSTVPYNFESRERQDGRWERYDQGIWRFNGNGETSR